MSFGRINGRYIYRSVMCIMYVLECQSRKSILFDVLNVDLVLLSSLRHFLKLKSFVQQVPLL